MISAQAIQYLVYPLELVNQRRASLYTMDIQICKPHSSANWVIKWLIYLEARACFSVHSGIHLYILHGIYTSSQGFIYHTRARE